MKRYPFACATVLSFAAGVPLMGACNKTTAASDAVTGVSAIVFVKRAHTQTDAEGNTTVDVANGNGQTLDYTRFVPGGSLNILSPARPDGVVTNLTADFPAADFNGADVSFDATEVVFSMRPGDGDDYFHVYRAKLTAGPDGKFEIHQLTAGSRNDITPIYIPGQKVAFVTDEMYTAMGTRADEYEHARAATQLATISVDGGDADRRLFSQNLSHSVAPWLRADGRIGYSRWEHLGPVNDVKLMVVNPDGSQMLGVAGQNGKPSNTLFSVKEVSPNVMIGIATSRNRTIHAGALVKIDARNQDDPVCLDAKADQTGHPCLDKQRAQFEILTKDVPTGNGPSPVGRYREPSLLPDGRILVSWASGPVNDLAEQSATPPDFGIYVFDPATQKNQLVYNDRGFWDVNAMAVAPRAEPTAIQDVVRAGDPGEPVRIGSIDVKVTNLEDRISGAQFDNVALGDALKETVKVRVIEGFSSEGAPGITRFGLTMHEGAAILGEANVYKDGSWLANIPPYLPVHLQPVDKFGLAIRNQMLWIQGMPGEDRRCIGCHESRIGVGVPAKGPNPTVAEQTGPLDFTEAIADRAEYPWDKKVQPILDAKCVQCHDGGANDPFAGKKYTLSRTNPTSGAYTTTEIPYLKLTKDPIAVYYDMQTMALPISYVSIFYPAAMTMGMGNTTITGDVPPMWGLPGDARRSKLIEKVNVKADDGATAWAAGLHPEDKNVTLTPEERQALVRVMDLGGQYWSRQNTDFKPYTADPSTGAGGTPYK